MDFPGITKQARWIAKLYKFLGLWSIPILTIATTISIANVFMRGQLASDTRLQFAWAVLFAAAIEVNIVRLFFEAKLDKDRGAFVLGIVLAFVAGVALIIEGLQQSIGFDWNNVYVQSFIGLVVALRVCVVVWLLAREGSKLASALSDTEQPIYACFVQFDTPKEPEVIQKSVPIRVLPQHKNNPTQNKIRAVLKSKPDVSIRTLAEKAGVSPGTAQKYKNLIDQEQQVYHLNGTH
jgi:hypothetical protein